MRLDLDVFGDTQFSRELLRFGERADDMSPAFTEIADQFLDIEERQFATQGMYSGGWAPLKPATVRRKEELGHDPRILHATRALRDSLTNRGHRDHVRRITDDELVVGTSVRSEGGFPYAAAHQNPKKGQTQRRPIEFNEAVRRDFVKIIQNHLVAGRARTW